MAAPGLSTIGVLFAYAIETTAGTKPTAFTKIDRINSIDGLSLENEQIDASALEDAVSKYVAGRSDPGGTLNVSFNVEDSVITAIESMYTTYGNRGTGCALWLEVYHPSLTKSYFMTAEPPAEIPMPASDQNSLWVAEMGFTVVDYKGLDTAIIPT